MLAQWVPRKLSDRGARLGKLAEPRSSPKALPVEGTALLRAASSTPSDAARLQRLAAPKSDWRKGEVRALPTPQPALLPWMPPGPQPRGDTPPERPERQDLPCV